MKKVLVFGTFDVIHPGHISFLTQAREKGDYLIVSVARDSFVRSFKRKDPVYDGTARRAHLMETGLVDKTVLSDGNIGEYSVVLREEPQVVCFGHDQDRLKADFVSWMQNNGRSVETHTLDAFRPDRYKSSKISALNRRSPD